ncbi:MAG: hypothetical protein ACJ0RL_05055 [Porticoccaceae bacterium]
MSIQILKHTEMPLLCASPLGSVAKWFEMAVTKGGMLRHISERVR